MIAIQIRNVPAMRRVLAAHLDQCQASAEAIGEALCNTAREGTISLLRRRMRDVAEEMEVCQQLLERLATDGPVRAATGKAAIGNVLRLHVEPPTGGVH